MNTKPLVDHAKQRASERYGVKVNRDIYYSLVHKIQTGKAVFIERKSNTRTIWKVGEYIVVYSSRSNKIVTFLPDDCVEMKRFLTNNV